MKTESNVKQERILIEPIDAVMVRVTLNANETESNGIYLYDTCSKEVINRPILRELIERDFDAWVLSFAQEAPRKQTVEQRISKIETVIDGAPPLVEMIEALNILLGE